MDVNSAAALKSDSSAEQASHNIDHVTVPVKEQKKRDKPDPASDTRRKKGKSHRSPSPPPSVPPPNPLPPTDGLIRVKRRPENWVAPGPQPAGNEGRPDLVPGPNEDLCSLVGNWRIFQHQQGNRWCCDDLLAAWLATGGLDGALPTHQRHVDLGCGIGSVLMMVSWRLPGLRSVGVEAQPISVGLARRSLAYNGCADRCEVVSGDFRDAELLQRLGPGQVDLVTGTPPYFRLGSGYPSTKPQRCACRYEYRGGFGAYCDAARVLLVPERGRFVVLETYEQVEEATRCARAAGLEILRRLDMLPKEGVALPKFTVFEMKLPLATAVAAATAPAAPVAAPAAPGAEAPAASSASSAPQGPADRPEEAGAPPASRSGEEGTVAIAPPPGEPAWAGQIIRMPIRDRDNYWSLPYQQVRRDMGMPCFPSAQVKLTYPSDVVVAVPPAPAAAAASSAATPTAPAAATTTPASLTATAPAAEAAGCLGAPQPTDPPRS
ncbi:putative SAM-dependent methyltransferase [Paratrimastix pyriformis]|uniref:SAM-dependent methyltransferase n=1 Tax=Paratrimastix pyriformis TaxID=342808 RepID=A0ABQ8UMB4_9EUKA|nr:putative SAM-dependent methyltransferase [Paratrimastix pyriformis]